MSWISSARVREVGAKVRSTATSHPVLAMGVAGVVAVTMIASPGAFARSEPATSSALKAAAALATASDATSAVERERVDSVPAPKLDWYDCFDAGQCATVKVPLDYDQPNGAKVELAVARVKARKPNQKIGSLFVNPGGPGGSGVDIALAAPYFLGDDVLDRFDVVGFDPRGIANSEYLKCFKSAKEQSAAYKGLNVAFPFTAAEERAYIASAKAVAKGCSTTGKKLAGAMSTAEAARDMDLLRRAVGDSKLTYLGFSYGTALGQFYANMFPDRVRAIVVDGVLDPTAWTGSGNNEILDARLRSSDGAYRALREVLVRCDQVGKSSCEFASGNPVKKFETLTKRLRTAPAVIDDGMGGTFTITYAEFIGAMLGSLYSPYGYLDVAALSQMVYEATAPKTEVSDAARKAATKALAQRIKRARAFGFPYDNGFEAFSGVLCTDGRFPANPASWPAATAAGDKRAPYFGRVWGWVDVQCAGNAWTVRDEDAYTGPFNRRTSAPVLIVGNYYDPATNYDAAVSSSKLLPNSRLLSSDSWGHTAYGTSACVTGAVDKYLLRGALPAQGTVCVGDIQPFAEPLPGGEEPVVTRGRAPHSAKDLAAKDAPAAGARKQLPPVVAPVPPSILNGTGR